MEDEYSKYYCCHCTLDNNEHKIFYFCMDEDDEETHLDIARKMAVSSYGSCKVLSIY